MMKKILALIMTATIAAGLTVLAHAEEVKVNCDENAPSEACIMLLTQPVTDSAATAPVPVDYPETDIEEVEVIDETEDEDAPAEAEMWTVYLSFGALAAVVVVFIILNCFGGKKK